MQMVKEILLDVFEGKISFLDSKKVKGISKIINELFGFNLFNSNENNYSESLHKEL